MFGIADIIAICDLELRDTQSTYHDELNQCWEEFLRNLPRESFSINLRRDIEFRMVRGKATYTAETTPEIAGIIDIHAIKVEYGNVYYFLERCPMNATDIFNEKGTPWAIPFWYEYVDDRLKIYPAAGEDYPCFITASLGNWNGAAKADVQLDERYKTFAKYYVMTLLYSNYLRDDEVAALMEGRLANERQKLETVRYKQVATGRIQPRW